MALPKQVTEPEAYRQLEKPHQEVHESAKQAIECYEKGDLDGEEKAFRQLQVASDHVIS